MRPLAAVIVLVAGCSATPVAPPVAPPPPSAATIYVTQLRPLLQERCGRCHFPGGKMHHELPFDVPVTLAELGTERLFTRIEDEAGRALVNDYFAALARERQ